MSEKTYQLITLGQAIATTGLDRDSFWEQAQAVNAKLLLQLPSGAVLQAKDKAITMERRTRLNSFTVRRLYTELPLAGKDYFIPCSSNLVAISKLPEVACDHVTHVATRLQGQAAVSIFSIGEATLNVHSMDNFIIRYCKAGLMSLLLPANTNVTIDEQRAYMLEADIERIQNSNTAQYPPSVEDYGAFKPSKYTTRMICDMNTAYHLFRVKSLIDPKSPSSMNQVKDWFNATWNNGEKLKLSMMS